MEIFKCSKCDCIENTAFGFYWMHNDFKRFIWSKENEQFKGKPLCSECAPIYFDNGKPTGWGKWHDKFPKENISTLTENERADIYNN